MVTLARLPLPRSWRWCARSTRCADLGRPRRGRGPATPASVTLYGFLIALARRGQDKPLVGLSMGFAAPTDYTRLDLARTPLLPRASRENTQEDTQEDTGRRPRRRAFGG